MDTEGGKYVGRRVRLTVDYGNEPGRLLAGTEGVVRELVGASVKGAHDSIENAVVVEFPQEGSGPRAVAFGAAQIPDILELVEE